MNKEVCFGKSLFAFSQIFMIVFSVFSISFIIYESGNVSAEKATLNNPSGSGNTFNSGYLRSSDIINKESPFKFIEEFKNGKMIYKVVDIEGKTLTTFRSYEDAVRNAKSWGVDLTESVNWATENILGKATEQLGNLEVGQSFGDGLLKVQSIQTFDGKTTVTFVDPLEKMTKLKGASTDSVASAFGIAGGNTPYSYTVPLFGFKITNFLTGNLVEGFVWSLEVASAIQLIGGLAGFDQSLANSLTFSAIGGIMSGKLIYGLIGKEGSPPFFSESLTAGQFSTLIGIGIAVGIFLLTYKDTEKKVVSFECLPWEAPLGGSKCEQCNNDPLMPCSEYRCKSLGQACDLVNKGTSDEKCVWVNPKDVNAPMITPWSDVLTEGYGYTNHDTLPPSLGAKIVRLPNDCIQAFTPLKFGIITDEPAQCKIDITRTGGFDNMTYYLGDSLFAYNHTEKLNLPSPESLKDTLNGTDAPEIPIDGHYNFFVRCRDANGNQNEQDFVFQLCVDPSPDTTPPVIVDTSIKSGSFVNYGPDSINLDLYVNEPADCKWSVESKAYDDMENSMSCSREIYELNAQQLYTCSSNLTGIKDRQDNNFYFRCKDQPLRPENERNVNTQSYQFNLKGSQPLSIISVAPNETIFGSTETVELKLNVETRDGAEAGKSICYFSPSGDEGSYVSMFNTNNYLHSQTLTLGEGAYQYFFRCVDAGGNADSNYTRFNVEVDKDAPIVTRAYRADGLKIVTDEDAQCSYSLNSCDFTIEDGLNMIYSNPEIKNVHFAEWTPNLVYYIKCKDLYNNQPAPNECSIIASASNVK